VAHVLVESGVEPGRLIIEARGEADSKTTEGDMDGYAFDRRVTVKIEHEETAVARN
jgi:outer membrane protein OmpA-like peptidoglycan-associated protein